MNTTTPVGSNVGARRAAPKRRVEPQRLGAELTAVQVRWMGALLLAAQLPHLPYVPVWSAFFGVLMIATRLALLWRDSVYARSPPMRLPSWLLAVLAALAGIGVKWSFGYFLGRDPCVAFLFMLVGIKFLEARSSRDGTILVCLGGFLLVTPFFYSQSLFAAVAAIPGVLLMGATLEMLARNTARQSTMEWKLPIVRTAKLAIQGIPLAAMLFVLFPRLAAPLWGLPSDQGAQTGLTDKMRPGSISELSITDGVAFRVDFDGAIPPNVQRYWRGPVLTRFDGEEWSAVPSRLDGVLTPVSAGTTFGYTVTLEPHQKPWLFALDLPVSLPTLASTGNEQGARTEVAGLTRNQQLIARNVVTQTLRYYQRSVIRDRFPGDGARDAAENLRLPARRPGFNPRAFALADEWRGRFADDREFIGAVLRWFRAEPFVYTLSNLQVYEDNAVDGFLFDSRRGFCEHYAGAFVFLLRAAGIPSRVVTGYQGGEINPRGGYMIVRQSDAHAWAEALIDGEWRRFDPTAAVAPSRIEVGLGGALPIGEPVPLLARLDVGWLKGAQLLWDALNHDWRRQVVGFNYDKQRSLMQDWKLDRLAHWQFVAMIAGIAFSWVALILAWIMWRKRHQDRARSRWNAFCARLARAGLPRLAHEGPLAYAARAGQRWPRFAPSFRRIGDLYATLRYGPGSAHADDHRERALLISQFERAIAALPALSALRAHGATR